MIPRELRRALGWVIAVLGSALWAHGQSVTATVATPVTNIAAEGGTVTLTATINYPGQTLTSLGWSLNLPPGWSYVSSAGTNVPSIPPQAGDTLHLDWAYLDPSVFSGTAQFTTTLSYAAGLLGNQTITGMANYKISGTSTLQTITLPATNFGPPSMAPLISIQPVSQSVLIGSVATVTVAASGSSALTYQWQKNGQAISGATNASLSVPNFQPENSGPYSVIVTSTSGSSVSRAAALGVTTTDKLTGAGQVVGTDIIHPNGNVYDQVLVTGAAVTVKADPNQVVRLSFVDDNDDIVQVEFAGAGALTLTLENPSGPAIATKYNQPAVQYMKGHASITIAGADQSTNLLVFTVGTNTAFNQALFKGGEVYDAVADIGLISIASSNGQLGGVRAADARLMASTGLTGINAPGVAVVPGGPVYLGNVSASGSATSVVILGSTTDMRVTGGDLLQLNNRAVQVDGMTRINFTAGTKSNGQVMPAQVNSARLEQNGVDVTAVLAPPN